jgi:hypothetical protein
LEIPSDFRIVDERVLQIYPLTSPKLFALRSCPCDDAIHCTFQVAILSLSLLHLEKTGAAQHLLNAQAMLKEAHPEDNLLASITYVLLVLPLLIFNNDQVHCCHVPGLCRKYA